MKKIFSLRTVLTVTTGRLLTKPKSTTDNGISDLYELLNHMTGDSPYTHSLGRFSDECKPKLLMLFPELKNADLQKLDALLGETDGINTWLDMCESQWGMSPEYSLEANSINWHKHKNPVEELAAII